MPFLAKNKKEFSRAARRFWWLHCGRQPGPSLDGGMTTGGKQYKCFWNKAANYLLRYGFEPGIFYLSQYVGNANYRSPAEFFNESGAARCKAFNLDSKVSTTRIAFDCDVSIFKLMLLLGVNAGQSKEFIIRSAISSPDRRISPMFSCWIAEENKFSVNIDRYYEACMMYLLEKPFYDAVWPNIPSTVTELADNENLWTEDVKNDW